MIKGIVLIEGEKLAIIADDFTGAGDAGIHFARSGSRAELLLHVSALDGAPLKQDAIAITTETRFLSPEDAATEVARAISLCQSSGYCAIYKKIDSTMRGNPGSEIEAALSVTGQGAAIICPAMPETGRTCVGGVIWLNGEPLHRSDIGSDPFHPLETSEIAEILRAQTLLPIAALELGDIEAGSIHMAERVKTLIAEGTRLITADATNGAHLEALARLVMSENLLPVGAGGFARAVAAEWAKGKKGRPEAVPVHGAVARNRGQSRSDFPFPGKAGKAKRVVYVYPAWCRGHDAGHEAEVRNGPVSLWSPRPQRPAAYNQ